MIASVFTNLLGGFVFFFIFWKRLREDYSPEIIFKAAFSILAGILGGFLLAVRFFPQAFMWFSFVGSMVGLAIIVWRLKIRFYETFEAFIISVMPWIGLSFFADSVIHSSLSSFLAFIAILFLLFISYYFDAHYKNFTWYKSGKVGFAGLATFGIFFTVRSVLAIFGMTMLSFVGLKFEAVISGAAAIICFVLLFNLAGYKE